jgi:DNA polymerase V
VHGRPKWIALVFIQLLVVKFIPITASAGITGFESPASDYLQLALSSDELLIEHPSATFIGKADGQSMQGVGIFSGDILIVDRHLTTKDFDIIVANLNGEFICKILNIIERLLLSANIQFKTIAINVDDQFTIEGVEIRLIRGHRPSHLLEANF